MSQDPLDQTENVDPTQPDADGAAADLDVPADPATDAAPEEAVEVAPDETDAEDTDADEAAEDERPADADGDVVEDPAEEFRRTLRSQLGDWYVIHSYAGYENRV